MGGRSVITKTGHAKATVEGIVVADTDSWHEVEGNVYFPPESLKKEYFSGTDHTTGCPWKGEARYYSIGVNGKRLENVAWYYNEPLEKVTAIKDHVAFYKGKVDVVIE